LPPGRCASRPTGDLYFGAIGEFSSGTDNPAWATREALQRRQAALAAGRTLALETTLAGAGALRFMEVARQAGHWIVLHYVSVNSAEQALLRIRNRVALGGHDVPGADVRRRFARSHANLPLAILRADEVVLYDNIDPAVPHREVAMLSCTRRCRKTAIPPSQRSCGSRGRWE